MHRGGETMYYNTDMQEQKNCTNCIDNAFNRNRHVSFYKKLMILSNLAT